MKIKPIFPLPKIMKESNSEYFSFPEIKCYFSQKSEILRKIVEKISKENSLPLKYSNINTGNLKVIIEKNLKELNTLNNREESYSLKIKKNFIEIKALTEKGAFYGLHTLRHILNISKNKLREIEIIDWPDLKFRGVHLTLGSGHMPKFENMKSLIEKFASYKINYLIFEYDDRFPWEKHRKIVHPLAFSKQQIEQLIKFAKENFIEIIPLIDSLGHAEYYLKHKEYAHLREVPDRVEEMCPSNPKTLKFIKELWEEVLEVHKDSKYAHITGDEVFRLGRFCSKCERYAKSNKLAQLYTKYYKDLSRWIIKKGKIPMMWGDMLIKYPEDIKNFPKDVLICDWCYFGIDKPYWNFLFYPTSEENKELFKKYLFQKSPRKYTPFPYFKFFKDNGFETIGATSASQSKNIYPVPSFSKGFANNKRFAMTVKENNGLGLLITNWTGSSSIEANFYGILAGADFSWYVRDEKEEEFSKRFVKSFLLVPASFSKILKNLDKQINEPVGFENFSCKKETLKNARIILNSLKNLKKENFYCELLKWVSKVNLLHKELLEIFGKINSLFFSGGKDFPVDIRAYTNYNFRNYTAWPISVKPGIRKIYGIQFNIINPEENNGKSLIVSEGITDIKIDKKLTELFFLYTGYQAPEGTKLAEFEIVYKDKRKKKISIITGKNIADWWRNPYVLNKAIPAWHGNTPTGVNIFLYISWWINPFPKEKIEYLRIIQKDKIGRILLIGLTGKISGKRGINKEKIRKLRDNLKEIEMEIIKRKNEIEKIYYEVMGKEDVEKAMKKITPVYLNDWINKYKNILKNL